ncbi:MAG: class I mannose-6-phosphate isomerase [Treponema sp.]|nr:class I mannose-6-phosphate isomerase [Treponema sp.]MCR4630333.1 class I mannose-6-phosphate isomerase [Treponema sp.]
MLKLSSIKSDKIWGYELWIASTHPNGCQDDFKTFCGGEYPLLVKVIQADDTLSIQVHPDDDWAVKLEGEGNRGKTECWYVLDAKPGAKIVYGIKEGFSNDVLAKAITDNNLEDYLDMVEVKKGDFIFIPAGTVHAIGAGLRLMEVQQSCDLTYRLYDWGRGREVHIEKGLAVIKREEMIPVAPFPKTFDCKYFNMQEIDVKGGWSMICPSGNGPEAVQLLYVLEAGAAVIRGEGLNQTKLCAEDIFAVKPGEKVTIEGNAKIMRIIAK